MADFDDNDFDIDELLDEIDSSGTKGKDPTGDTGAGDKKNVVSSAGGSKSVRFSEDKTSSSGDGKEDDFLSTAAPKNQRESPYRSSAQSAPSIAASGKPPLPTSISSGRSTRSSASNSAAGTGNNDWLGLDEKGSLSPAGSPPAIQRRSGTGPTVPVIPELTKAATATGNSSEEEDALFNDIGLTRPSGRRSALKSGGTDQPPIKSGAQPQPQKSRFGLDSNPTTPPMSLGNQDITMPPPKSSGFSLSHLDQLGMSPPPSAGDSKAAPSLLPKHQPLPSTASLLGGVPSLGVGGASSMYPQDFPPPIPPKIPSGDSFQAFSLTAPPTPSPLQQQVGGPPSGKKKVVKKDTGPVASSILTSSSTLQLPSHLINEEELKLMSSSLKTLYANQLEMLEKSYREQMLFLSEANKRKEDLLKEEMKGMQTDYEERLERLKNEVRELEHQKSQKEPAAHPDVTALATLSEQLNASIVTVRDVLQKSQEIGAATFPAVGTLDDVAIHGMEKQVENILLENLERSQEHQERTDEKFLGMIKSIDQSVEKRFTNMNDAWRNLLFQVKQNMTELMEASATNANRHSKESLEEEVRKSERKVMGQLETIGKIIKGKEDLSPKLVSKIEESEKLLLGELAKLNKLQRKTKDSADGITLEPLVKLLESDREEEQRRRERLALHLKEMRRDLKRILLENEGRQESTQKFSMSTEMELKSISQSIRDLNSQLKFSLISGPHHPENLTNQFNSSMQQTQAEMEMKLLREERQALSESMANINVEKRKLSEDKVGLEKQKLDFQKERDQLRNLELQLKTKLDETEELQKKTDSVRREEIHLTSEAQMKMRELDKEKLSLREKLMEVEQRLRLWEQKLRQEKVDLMRERELVERLRDQLLCPGCLKTNEHAGMIHPPPPPYISMDVNSGSAINSVTNDYLNSRLNRSGGGGDGGSNADDLFDTYYRKLFE